VLHLIDLNDIWIYIYEKGEARYTDLIKAFVDTKKRSKTVLLRYKIQLEAEGKIMKKISATTKRPVYYVPERFHLEVEKLKTKRDIHSLTDSLETNLLNVIKGMLTSVLAKLGKAGINRRWVIETQIFMFIPQKVGKNIKQHLYMVPLKEDAIREVVDYLKKTKLID